MALGTLVYANIASLSAISWQLLKKVFTVLKKIFLRLNPALISIAKISQALHHEAYWGRTQSEGKTKSSHNYSTHSEAHSSLGLSGVNCTVLHPQRLLVTTAGFIMIFLSYQPRQEAKAWPGLPALASPTLGLIHQSSQQKTFQRSKCKMVHRQEPQAAVGHRVGGIIMATFSFALHFEFYLNELHDEVLEIFFAGNTKENCKFLKPVSFHYRNEA